MNVRVSPARRGAHRSAGPARLLAALALAVLLGAAPTACGTDAADDVGAGTGGPDVVATPDVPAGPGDDAAAGGDAATTEDGAAGAPGDALAAAPDTVPDTAPDTGADTAADRPPVQARPPAHLATDEQRRPRDVHLTWQRDPATSVTVQWRTEDVDLAGYRPFVWFAPAAAVQGEGDDRTLPLSPGHVFEGAGVSYPDYMADGAIYVQWTVELTGLEPQTEYVYLAGTWDDADYATGTFEGAVLTPVHRFRTGLPRGTRAPFRFVAAGDSRGGYDGIRANIGRLDGLGVDFWLFNGDMNQTDARGEWSAWFEAMAPVLEDTVLMPVQGNHEFFGWTYYELFALPREPDLADDLQEYAWSLDYGNVHFVGLNSSLNIPDQVPWLEADLAAATQDPEIDWIVVLFHHAAYSASKHGSTPTVQRSWVPLFDRFGVDLVFNGHDHNYERTHPIEGDALAAPGEGVVYVVAGAFFAPPYGNGQEWWTATSTHGDVANYAVVEVDGRTLRVVAYSGDGQQVLDDFTLTK